MINEKEAIEKLRIDEHYYGDFGKKFLSNSDISTLLKNPLELGKTREQVPAFLVGGYFHTAILEPDKLKKLQQETPKSIKSSPAAKCVCCSTRLINLR